MIYAIQAVGTEYIKFGIATNLAHRLCILQVGCPFDLIIVASCAWFDSDEARIHMHLSDRRVRGEWFRRGGATEAVIDAMIQSDLAGFRGAFLARSNHNRLGKALDFCRDVAEHNIAVRHDSGRVL